MKIIKFKKQFVSIVLFSIIALQFGNVAASTSKKGKMAVGIASILSSVGSVCKMAKKMIIKPKKRRSSIASFLAIGSLAILSFSWLFYMLLKKNKTILTPEKKGDHKDKIKIPKNIPQKVRAKKIITKQDNILAIEYKLSNGKFEKQKEYKKIVPLELRDLQKGSENFKHEGRAYRGCVFYDKISDEDFLLQGKMESSKLFKMLGTKDIYYYYNYFYNQIDLRNLFIDKEKKKEQEEILRARARLFKIHLQIKPEYLDFFSKDFDKLTKENGCFKNIQQFKVKSKINKKDYIEKYKKDNLAFPTVIIYVCLVSPEDRYEVIKSIVQGIWDRYKFISKEIYLPIAPRFNKQVKDFIYIAGGHADNKIWFCQCDTEGSTFNQCIYTDDYVFFKGHEIDVDRLSKEIVKDNDLKKNLFAKTKGHKRSYYQVAEDRPRIYDVLVHTSS